MLTNMDAPDIENSLNITLKGYLDKLFSGEFNSNKPQPLRLVLPVVVPVATMVEPVGILAIPPPRQTRMAVSLPVLMTC